MPFPNVSAVAAAALIPLIIWRIYARFRRAVGRQRLSRYRAPITLTIYTALIGAIALSNLQHPAMLFLLALSTITGAALGGIALTRTRFQPTPKGLYYVPYSPIGLTLAILFVARVAYRVVEVYLIDSGVARSAAEFAQSPLTLLAFGLLAGYHFWYALGLASWRHKVLIAKRAREARASDA